MASPEDIQRGVDPGPRCLAQIVTIREFAEIPGSDNIVLASFDQHTYQVVVKKGEFQKGEKVIYFAVDAVLNESPDIAFLKGKRVVEQRRIRGVLSQGLVGPCSWLTYYGIALSDATVGRDVTAAMRVTKHVEPEEKHVYRDEHSTDNSTSKSTTMKFSGHLVPHTDEPRIQNLLTEVKWLLDTDPDITITTKFDGTSCTLLFTDKLSHLKPSFALLQDDENKAFSFFVCSRNNILDGSDPNDKPYFQMVKDAKLHERLAQSGWKNIAIQGELCGPKMNGNRLQLDRLEWFVFNIYDIAAKQYMSSFKLLPSVVQNSFSRTKHKICCVISRVW